MKTIFRSQPVASLVLCLGFSIVASAQQLSCPVEHAPTDPASQALAREDYSTAAQLYAAQVKAKPADLDAIAGEVRSLIGSHQVSAAAALAQSSFAVYPKSAILVTTLGEVRYRQGRLNDAFNAYRTAMQLNPCLARTRYDLYRFMRTESMNATAYSQLQVAHALEPNDPDIRVAWIYALPLAERARQLDTYLAAAKDQPAHRQQSMRQYERRLHAILTARNSQRHCRLASASSTATKFPFDYLDRDEAGNYHGIGFDVKINNKASARLELDTGASGILLNRGTARKAGLTSMANDSISGIGDQKSMSGYWAYADDLRIGKLEFKNCMVEVSNKRSIMGIDGLIGADVFENYHVRLDFPMRQMDLSPLPVRPGEVQHQGLNASGVGSAAAASAATKGKGSNASASHPPIRYRNRYIAPEMASWSPFARSGDHILLAGELKDQQPRLFLLDSGSELSFLSTAAGKTVGRLHRDQSDRITGLNGRVKDVYTVGGGSLIFAGFRQPFRQMMVINLDSFSNNAGMEVSGIIGLNSMIWLTVDIDYRDGLIHASYNPKRGMNGFSRP